jgi:hypothetical protein
MRVLHRVMLARGGGYNMLQKVCRALGDVHCILKLVLTHVPGVAILLRCPPAAPFSPVATVNVYAVFCSRSVSPLPGLAARRCFAV